FRPIPRMSMTLDIYRIDLNNRIRGTNTFNAQINGQLPAGIPLSTVQNIKNAIALNDLPIDPKVLSSGSYAVTEFANGIDTLTHGADLTFQFPVDYSWGHVNWTIDGAYNDTYITKLPQTAPALAGYQLYSAGDTSVLTTASPHIRINFGGYW